MPLVDSKDPPGFTLLSRTQPLGNIIQPEAVVIDGEGQLYVADAEDGGRIQKRDRNGTWTLVASAGRTPDAVKSVCALAVDASGCLYVAAGNKFAGPGRIRKRDSQGTWTTLGTEGTELGQLGVPRGLALDGAGNLYISDSGDQRRILLRKANGQWTLLAKSGSDVGEVMDPTGLAVDPKGNLYVADAQAKRIQKRDLAGQWSVVDVDALAVGALTSPGAITTDTSGSLYVYDGYYGPPINRLLKRDPEGHWSELLFCDGDG